MNRKITETEIMSQMTENGGWTKKTLAGWGVKWPPIKGWKEQILKNGVPAVDGENDYDNLTDEGKRLKKIHR